MVNVCEYKMYILRVTHVGDYSNKLQKKKIITLRY